MADLTSNYAVFLSECNCEKLSLQSASGRTASFPKDWVDPEPHSERQYVFLNSGNAWNHPPEQLFRKPVECWLVIIPSFPSLLKI